MRRLLHWWLTILDDKTPAEAVVYALLGAVTVVILFFIVRGAWAVHRYTPDEGARVGQDPRPTKPTPPRAAGAKSRRIA